MRRAALGLLLLAGMAIPAPAHAAPGFDASIVSMGPALPQAGSTITLGVALSNPSTADVTNVTARLLISTAPLYGRSEIPEVLSGRLLPTYRLIEQDAATGLDLSSGVSTTITLRATAKQLGLSASRPGAYVLGVQVDGTVGGRTVTERRVTFLPWMPGKVQHRLGVTTVWTLTAPPSLGVDGVFVDDSLASALATGGRLRRQLDAMSKVEDAVWLVDPTLAESVQALAAGARIRDAAGNVRATSDDEMRAATQWLQDLRTAVATGTLAALPMADLDVRAAMKFGRVTVARRAMAEAPARLGAVLGASSVPLIVPLYAGAVTDSTWRFLREAGASAAIVSDQGYPATQQQYTPSSAVVVPAFNAPVVATDHVTSATPVTSGLSETANRQAFAAQLLMTYLERPNDARVITVAIAPTWSPDSLIDTVDVLNAPWLAHADIGAATAAGADSRGKDLTPATHAQQLQEVDLERAVDEQRMIERITDDVTFTKAVDDAVVCVLSRWWTGRQAEDRYSALTAAQLTTYAKSVRVVTRGDIVFGGERGVVPVTIANGLPVAIDIVLRATGLPSVRVQPTPQTTIHLNAGKRVSVEVPTRVTGSGEASLQLDLQTKDGTLIDGPVLLTVRSAAYARVAQYLVAIAFAALLLLIGANAFRRIRHRGEAEDET